MKHIQKRKIGVLQKMLSLFMAFGMLASTSGVGLFVPQVAEATGGHGQNKGDIWVCKTLLDAEGNLISGNDNSQRYTIDFTDGPMKPTINFNGPLNYNTDLFDDIDGNDAECQKNQINNAQAGDYYYSQEVIKQNPELYETPRYHDGYQGQATQTSELVPFDVDNDLVDGHIVLKKGDTRVLVVLNQLKEVQSEIPDSANLYATKVVCEDEQYLPDWGAGSPDITSTTATTHVANSGGKCEIVDWDFQWAPSDTLNPGDNLGNQATWTTFGSSTTIPESSFGDDKFVWVREVFDDDYVPFTGVPTEENPINHVSAEVYCGTDGLHYDNYDRVDDLEVGKDYYCVGFNALKDTPITPEIGRCELEGDERWADSVKEFEQGERKNNTDVLSERSDETKALGVEVDADIAIDYVSLGFGGEIVLEFIQPFVDAPGDDIKVYETSYGNPSFASYPEQAEVSVSSDGVNFTLLGTAKLDTTFDLAGIYTDPVRFIKVKDTSDPTKFGNDADGFDLAGIEILVCETNGEPTQCIADLNLLENPGFETPIVDNNAGWNIFASGFSGLGWLVEWISPDGNAPAPANAELHAGVNGWNPSEGDQYIELDSDYDGPGGSLNGESASTKISQTVDTVDGETYTLTYDFSPRPGVSPADNVLKVWVNGDEVEYHSADGAGNSNTDWNTFSYSFVANSATTTIAFSDGGTSNSNGTFLDNTSLTCVPEPVIPDPDKFSITGNKTEVWGENSADGDGWTIYLLDLDDEMEEFEVDSESDTGIDSSSLTNGETYLVQVSGTYKFGNSNRRADAEYSSNLGDWTDAADTYGDKLDLWIDGIAQDWGTYNSSHVYYTFIEGDGTSVNFRIDDTPRTDNDGMLTVKIYELDGLMSDTTDSNGNYSFENLNAGNYFIFEESRDGWEQVGPVDRATDYCEFVFVEGSETQNQTCDFINEGEDTGDNPGNGDDSDDNNEQRGSSRRAGQVLGSSTSISDDDSDGDSTEGEVMGAATSYPGLPNAGVAPAVEFVRTAASGMVVFALYATTSRRTLVLRKKAQ